MLNILQIVNANRLIFISSFLIRLCVVDCQFGWSSWAYTNETLECRIGTRQRQIIQRPMHGGTACNMTDGYMNTTTVKECVGK